MQLHDSMQPRWIVDTAHRGGRFEHSAVVLSGKACAHQRHRSSEGWQSKMLTTPTCGCGFCMVVVVVLCLVAVMMAQPCMLGVDMQVWGMQDCVRSQA